MTRYPTAPPPPDAWPRPQAPRPPPGRDIRVGAWTPQEVAYATRVADLYRAGSLPNVPDGITLRILLSKLLNCQPMRVSTCVEINQCFGCTDNTSLSHFSAMTRPSWLGRAARNRHRHAIEQASRRWREGRRDQQNSP